MITERPKITLPDSRKKLSQLGEVLLGCVADAGQLYQEICEAFPKVPIAFGGRARCSAVYALIAENVRTRIPGVENVEVTQNRGFVEVVLDEGTIVLRLRFKKVDHRLRTSNYPTKQQQMIAGQLPLFGEPQETVRLTVGYQFDLAGTEIIDVHVIYQHGRHPLWAYSLNARSTPSLPSLPLPSPKHPTAVAKVRSSVVKEREAANGTTDV